MKSKFNLKFLYRNQQETIDYWENLYQFRPIQHSNRIAKRLYNHTFRATIDLFVRECVLQNTSKILEIGCGWGRCVIGLRKRFPDMQITGIDLSSNAIEVAGELVEKEIGRYNLQFLQGNAEELYFPDESFDAVISTRVFQYVNNPEKAMREIYRVLKGNGRATIIVPNKLNPIRFFSYHTQLLTNSDIESWMRNTGFQEIRKGTIVFFPPKIKRFHENSLWVRIDDLLRRVPVINLIGGLAWASGRKVL